MDLSQYMRQYTRKITSPFSGGRQATMIQVRQRTSSLNAKQKGIILNKLLSTDQNIIKGTKEFLAVVKEKPEILEHCDDPKINMIVNGLSNDTFKNATKEFLTYVTAKPEILEHCDGPKINILVKFLADDEYKDATKEFLTYVTAKPEILEHCDAPKINILGNGLENDEYKNGTKEFLTYVTENSEILKHCDDLNVSIIEGLSHPQQICHDGINTLLGYYSQSYNRKSFNVTWHQ